MRIMLICHHTFSRSKHRQLNIAQYLSSLGHDVTVIVTSEKNRFFGNVKEHHGVVIVESPDLSSGRLRRGFDIYNTIWRSIYILKHLGKFDVVHMFETRAVTVFPGLLFRLRSSVPIFIDWVDWWGDGGLISVNRPTWYKYSFGFIESFFETYFRRFGDVNTVISIGLEKRAKSILGADKTVFRLRQGVDTREFFDIGIAAARAKVNISSDDKIFGFASQDSFYDFDYLLKTLDDLLSKKEMNAKIKFLVTGHVPPEVRASVLSKNLESYFIFTGFVSNDDYPVYLAACDYFILPFPEANYNLGRFPNKFGEYISIGRPIVTHSYGSLQEYEDLNVGYFAPSNAESLADGCLHCLRENREISYNFVSVAESLDWQVVLKSLPDLYTEQMELRR